MTDARRGMLQMLLCATMWSIGGVFIKLIPWNPFVLTGFRSLIAGTVVLGYLRAKRLRFCVSRRSLTLAFFLSGTFFSFVTATKLTSAANAIVIQYSAPVLILLYSAIFRRQRFHAADWLVVLLTVCGIGLFFLDRLDAGSAAGNLVAILSGVFFAGMFLSSDGVDEETRVNGILQGQLLTALIGVPLCLVFDTPVTTQAVLCICVLGIFQLGLPYILYALAMRACPPLACSLLAVMEPLLNPVWVFLFAGERPSAFALIGALIVLVSVTSWCVWNERRTRTH